MSTSTKWDPYEHPRYPENGEFAPEGEGEVIIGRHEHPHTVRHQKQILHALGVTETSTFADIVHAPGFDALSEREKFEALGKRHEKSVRSLWDVRRMSAQLPRVDDNTVATNQAHAIAESKQRLDLDYMKMTSAQIRALRPPQLTSEQFKQLVGKPFKVWTTEFAGGIERGNMESAYYPKHQVDPDQPGAALPARIEVPEQKWIRVSNPNNGKSIDVFIDDVGPYNIADAYWQHGNGNPNPEGRPMTEWQYPERKIPQNRQKGPPSSRAGLDVTPVVFDALDIKGKKNDRSATLIWQFIHPPAKR